jgi:dolichyl-diphosphooligosaccharide--protein glycosyltransferase
LIYNRFSKFHYFPSFFYSNKGSRAASQPSEAELAKKKAGFKKLPDETIDELNKKWDDNEKTSMMWEIIKNSERDEFMSVLSTNPELAHMRSKDGRGPIFWAHEYGRSGMIQVLRKLGVSEERADVNGVKPTEITHSSIKGSI